MLSHVDKNNDSQSISGNKESTKNIKQFIKTIDNRPEAIQQKRIANTVSNSPLMIAQRKIVQRILGSVTQKAEIEEEEMQEKMAGTHQLVGGPEEEASLQVKFENTSFTSSGSAIQKRENNTGLPDNLKNGVESLSGMSLDHVKVHYGSDKPAQLNALAYAQGSDIHVASGQEKHLPHEAWHVVQQMQGRVEPTVDVDGVPVNDSVSLENEADEMGAKALTI